MALVTLLTTFRAEVALHQGYISKAFSQDSAGSYVLNVGERSFVVDAAFLRIFIAWESFLEGAFVDYMMGQPSASGRIPTRFIAPPNEQHARDTLIGTQKYVDWSNPEIVRKLSKSYFQNGEPIDAVISANQSDLFDLKTLRNAAAHLTSTTGKSLDALASRRLLHTCTNISVSDFVLAVDPSSGTTGSTILTGYINMLDAAAEALANW